MNSSGWLVVLVLLLLGAGGAGVWIRAEGTPPGLETPPAVLVGRSGETLEIGLSDAGSGLRQLRVSGITKCLNLNVRRAQYEV